MSTDIRLAFNNLEARAEAFDGDSPADRISLRDYLVDVEIGAFQSERGKTQRVCFNIVVEVQPPSKPLRDDVDRILSYDTITDAIGIELAAERLNLLETLAERIAERILNEPRAQRVFIRIEKLDRGPGALGVEIVRTKSAEGLASGEPNPVETAAPLVVFLSNAAVNSKNLSRWIDQLESCGKPVVFCLAAADAEAPLTAVPAAQRRIDLLAVEQNAWVLAGQDQRCIVMRSRTELDWAIQNSQISVWAPSKMVLDSTDVIAPQLDGAMALVDWFCCQIDADQLILVGAKHPASPDLPVTEVSLDQADILADLPNPV